MIPGSVRRSLLLLALLALPALVHAQEAVLTGTVSDSTGAVLPGVTVTAVLEATGNRFMAVTDELGRYRIPVRVGGYVVSTELQGFTTVTRPGIQLLVGQTVTVNLQMSPSTVFNVFNSPNWTITTVESSPQYLQATAGQNRTAQVGFRLTF